MNAADHSSASSVRDRIMATAFELFYRQGYRATGINQVIDEARVAKASFYGHFPSKDDLLYAYLREAARRDIAEARAEAAKCQTARERFFQPLRMLLPWFEASDYRGCPFQNILAEAPPTDGRVRELARAHRDNIRGLLRELTEDLIKAEPRMKRLDPDAVADTYLILLEGAIVASVAYRASWPVDRAVGAIEAFLKGG